MIIQYYVLHFLISTIHRCGMTSSTCDVHTSEHFVYHKETQVIVKIDYFDPHETIVQ